MATGRLTILCSQQKQMLRSTPTFCLTQDFFLQGRHCKTTLLSSIKTIAPAQVRSLYLSRCLKETDKGPLNKGKSPSQGKSSFSVLQYIKKSIPLSVKFDVPIGNLSSGSSKDVGKNLGRPAASSSKKRLFEFFSVREFFSTPSSFMLYGLGGLIPFASVPIYMQFTSTYDANLAYLQLVYGSCILSFLGGVSWGFQLLKPTNANLKSLSYSIFLPLASWIGVLMHPNIAAFPLIMLSVAFAGYIDTHHQPYPLWFKNLRFHLTLLVFLSLFSTFVFSFTKASSDKKPDIKHVESVN